VILSQFGQTLYNVMRKKERGNVAAKSKGAGEVNSRGWALESFDTPTFLLLSPIVAGDGMIPC